jgi:conjugal transfer pilus assembly protein TraD
MYYEDEVAPLQRNQAIDALISVLKHNRDHYTKITANLLPVLDALTSGTLGKSLAPDAFDPADTRPIIDLSKVVRGGHVLYVALDALPDPAVASAIGAIILADLAALAGMRYNLRQQAGRISLFVDEVSNVINRPLIEILNKGAEAGLRVTVAMQTFSDLAERMGSQDAARMALGNLNNLIAFRSKDLATQEYIIETFGKTYIQDLKLSRATSVDGHIHDFTASDKQDLSSTREDIVPTDALVRLPNLQFFASVSGGKLFKGRVPILRSEP